jgi:hypothetical protein
MPEEELGSLTCPRYQQEPKSCKMKKKKKVQNNR